MGKMSKEDLFREIGEIDEAYVEEARRAGRRRRPAPWASRTLAAAASLVLCVGVGCLVLLVTQPYGNTGGAMDTAPGADGSAMNAAQEQYSMAEDTADQMAGGAMEEAEIQTPQEEASEKETGQAVVTGYGDPEAVPEAAPAQREEDQIGFSNTESDRELQAEPGQTLEDKAEAVTVKDSESAVVEASQQVSSAVSLTWEAARADADYGRYVDVQVPEGYSFTSGSRSASALRLTWNNGMEEISIICRQADEDVSDCLVDVEKPEEYDLGLYTVPWSDSVPQELIQRVSNAAFRPEQVTLEIVAARTYQAQESGEASGSRTRISILHDDNVLVEISSKGPSAEEIYAMINPKR